MQFTRGLPQCIASTCLRYHNGAEETWGLSPGDTVSIFRHAQRIQDSVLAVAEKRLLVWMADRTPAWVNSDHLTILGFAAQLLTGLAYAMSGFSRASLLAAVGFLALNWFGDSMDGTLARVRQQQRPRYGFTWTNILDSIGSVALMAGLAFSGYMSPLSAIGLLVLFLLLSIQSYLATYTTRRIPHVVLEFRTNGTSPPAGHRKPRPVPLADRDSRPLQALRFRRRHRHRCHDCNAVVSRRAEHRAVVQRGAVEMTTSR